jgi:hypothetical protein
MSTGEFRFRTGTVTGHKHLRKGVNNQDGHFKDAVIIEDVPYVFGAVADGCSLGGKKELRGQPVRTELGAVLLVSFIRSEIPLLLASHIAIEKLPAVLYYRCVNYLASIARATVIGGPEVLSDFIERNLLATLIGFVMNDKVLVTFSAGDGAIVINDAVTVIDQKNQPSYLAYHLIDRTILGSAASSLPQDFVCSVTPVAEVQRFAVSTDGIVDPWNKSPEIISGIWDYQPEAPAGLQWWLNIGGNNALFSDDCTIIGAKRRTEKTNADTV